MKITRRTLLAAGAGLAGWGLSPWDTTSAWAAGTGPVPACLPGEISAEDILNGVYHFPPSPAFMVLADLDGLVRERLGTVPAPGIHPRVLFGPDDLPDLRRRAQETEAGREMLANLRARVQPAILTPGTWGNQFYQRLAAEDVPGATAMVIANKGMPGTIGHYVWFFDAFVMAALDALLSQDTVNGPKLGAAIATYAQVIEPMLANARRQPMSDDIWRQRVGADAPWQASPRELIGYQTLGYGYDFAHGFMTEAQRAATRGVISRATKGQVWMGARLPHHWRRWNWVAIGLSTPLLALAIEGEDGYDPRVYRLGVQIARDYLTYAISPSGSSTEAVGYTQFGLTWGDPFFVAASRRGENLLAHAHHRAMLDWYLHSMEPYGGQWTSHGDGGDGGPAIHTLMMWRRFYPQDPRADFLWQNYVTQQKGKPYQGTYNNIEPLLWASDGLAGPDGKPVDYADGAALNLPHVWFDPVRSSLNARSAWHADATAIQFECRTDSTGPSHEHADRGNFTVSALGRQWAKENFRSVETRHHNCVLIDGLGQGYWPGPGRWLGHQDQDWAVMAACDAADCYSWWWPKTILTDDPATSPRFRYARWSDYLPTSEQFHQQYAHTPMEHDRRPGVVAYFQGFEQGGPRMWDEDGWSMRLPHNPVQCAFRTISLVRGDQPYVLVVDDIQKDDQERLYEWIMMTGADTDMASIAGRDIVLCDATVARDAMGQPRPAKGDRQLLVRILEMAGPTDPLADQAVPSIRLEEFERLDTLPTVGGETRSYGMDRRLIVPARAAAPRYKILLFPHRHGDVLPVTAWNAANDELTLALGAVTDRIMFQPGPDRRTRVTLNRPGQPELTLS